MQNEIQIDAMVRENRQSEQRLKKMKSNIQKLQQNMKIKKEINRSNLNKPDRQPATIYNHYQKEYTSTSPINTQKQFIFNSNLFRNINQSQPILENGSAVSNFSSVSNINNLLNGRLQQKKFNYNQQSKLTEPKTDINVLSDIDRLLEKNKKSKKIPITAFQKILDIKETKQSKILSQVQQVQTSRFTDRERKNNKKDDSLGKNTLQDYRRMIQKLQTIPEQKNFKMSEYEPNQKNKIQRHKPSNFSDQSVQFKQKPPTNYKKSELSYISNKSEFIQSNTRFPPLPTGRTISQNPVQRQKALIKQSFQQFKKLSTQVANQNLDKTQVDLELSDEQSEGQKRQSEEQRRQKKRKIDALVSQKQKLIKQLQQVQNQLSQLENSI